MKAQLGKTHPHSEETKYNRMKKLSTLFKKDPNDLGQVINEVSHENEWAFTDGIPIHGVKKSFPLIEGKTKSNVKKYNGVGRQAPPPPPSRTIKGNVS